ncbi:hypothetical protein F5141DRAFT_1094037 [Pisolithus sp. B1]|nr:hypothetical protein F5141DRAFT_1094037 [Pisolithus sp. B1]
MKSIPIAHAIILSASKMTSAMTTILPQEARIKSQSRSKEELNLQSQHTPVNSIDDECVQETLRSKWGSLGRNGQHRLELPWECGM